MKLSPDSRTLLKIDTADIENGICTIPLWVERLNDYAFSKIEGLTKVNLPPFVTHISDWAFSECQELTEVTISPSVTHIGTGAFKWCSSLTNITMPPSLTSISQSTFAHCTSLTEIAIPPSVNFIDMGAFAHCTSLTEITIPMGITELSYRLFTGCTGLTKVTIPPSVEHISANAFSNCTSLTAITIPTSVTHIGNGVFNGCTSLTAITIPTSVTHIGDGVFNGCTSLTAITIPTSVTHIGDGVFNGCTSLTAITIPTSVTHIGDGAFTSCHNLKLIVIDALDGEEYERMVNLIPQESRHLAKPSWGLKAKEQVIESLQPIGIDYFPKKLPESVISLIQQMEGRLNDELEKVPAPRRLEQLELYKHALAETANRFRQEQEMRLAQMITKEQEPATQRLIAVSKLEKLILITEVAIENAARKNPGFFNSSENKQKLSDSHARLVVTRKLITWLGGDETIRFTKNEKILLSRSKNSVTMILKKSGINPDELPSAPTLIGGGFCTIM